MGSRLGAGASCQSCHEVFGRIEDWKAPFTISCGHVFCVGCLSGARSTCRVCGNIFDRSAISKLLMLYGNTPRRSSITTSEEEYSRIQGEITSLNLDTPISRLDHVHAQGRYFLESQPRSLFKSLDANLNLLEYLLQAKQALLAQNALVDSLTDMIRQVRAEKEDLQMSLEAQRRQHVQEMNNMQGYLSQLIRTDEENSKLAADEALSLRAELHMLRNGYVEQSLTDATAIVRPDESPRAPTIRVHPASRSPSIASAGAGSPGNQSELSSLNLGGRISSNLRETGGTRAMTIHRSASFHSLSSEGAEASPSESLFISPFAIDLAYVPNDDSEYSHPPDGHLYASPLQSDGDPHSPHSDHGNFDLRDSFLNTLVSQAPSVEDEASAVGNDHTTTHEDEEYDVDDVEDADSIMAMSTTALPILRTPEPSRGLPGVQPANNVHSRGNLSQSAPTLPATIRTGPAPFLANLAILNDLLNDPRNPATSRVANASATILSRAAELLSAGNLPRLADNPTSSQHLAPNLIQRPRSNLTSQGFSMAEMRSCLIEVIARVFVNLTSDATIANQPSAFASMYTSPESSDQFSGFLDSLMESDSDLSNNAATVNSPVDSPNHPSGTNSDPVADLIDLSS